MALPNRVFQLPIRSLRRIAFRLKPHVIAWKVHLAYFLNIEPKPHGLSSPLIVSLTSFPARFEYLPLTLKCLLSQSVKPDRLILWVAHKDKDKLPRKILRFKKRGLEIQFCPDLGSFKKIVPTLRIAQNSFIVTADDDLHYSRKWLEELVIEYEGNDKEVICHRAHVIPIDNCGMPGPYQDWAMETICKDADPLVFPTTGAGVLYPPGVFHSDAGDESKFLELCPTADDIWFYWMMRLGGAVARTTKEMRPLYCWPGTQQWTLYSENIHRGANDKQIYAMIQSYGPAIFNKMVIQR